MKVVRRLNHRESQIQKKPKEVHHKVSKTIEKTKKYNKNTDFMQAQGGAHWEHILA